MGWLFSKQLVNMNFATIGNEVFISEKASLYNCSKIHIGNNVRIDDFCVISAGEDGIYIGNYVHIAVYVSIIGASKITISDFCGLSSRSSIYSSNDTYNGSVLTGPLIPKEYTRVINEEVTLEKHVIIGSGSVILPGVRLALGACIGALSLVKDNCNAFEIYGGNPARFLKHREKTILSLEEKFLLDK